MVLDDVVLDDGSVRKFGNIMPDPRLARVSAFQILPDQHMVAESEYDELLKGFTIDPWDQPFLPPRHQQSNRGQCNPEAGTTALEYLRAMQGLPHVALSAGDLYDRAMPSCMSLVAPGSTTVTTFWSFSAPASTWSP